MVDSPPENNDTLKADLQKPSGHLLIKNFVKTLPNQAGVYRMYDKNGDVLYVGKAKNLKNRVSAYTRLHPHNNRITHMIQATTHMEFIVTKSEIEALLLEANLIKQLQPRYNVLLRDDKTLPYVFISDHHRAPALSKHRGPRTAKGHYFGPFASPGAVNETIEIIQKSFLLRVCSDNIFEKRKAPCLLYQMKRCSAPCTCEISDKNYAELVKETKAFLKGKTDNIIQSLVDSMGRAAQRREYEQAAIYRDRIASLKKIYQKQTVHLTKNIEADIFAIAQQGGLNCIQVFFYRYGQNWGNKSYFPKADPALCAEKILQSFIMQFYDDKPIAKLIITAQNLPEMHLMKDALSLKSQQNIELIFPQKGEKKIIADHALFNAKEALARKLGETATQKYLFKKFAQTFGLNKIPQRIEVYDNSHLMGQNSTGGFIVATIDGFIKKQYRKFNIKSTNIAPGDDYAMMREVIKRRFTRLTQENDPKNWPDILLIDGGRGQLSAVNEVLTQLNLLDKVQTIAIAKGKDRNAGRERFFIANRPDFQLSARDEVLYFVQRLRDEAHRFVINIHRTKRQKSLLANPLNEIENIGPIRKAALLKHFGSAKNLQNATIDDITSVKGISKNLAEKILSQLKN